MFRYYYPPHARNINTILYIFARCLSSVWRKKRKERRQVSCLLYSPNGECRFLPKTAFVAISFTCCQKIENCNSFIGLFSLVLFFKNYVITVHLHKKNSNSNRLTYFLIRGIIILIMNKQFDKNKPYSALLVWTGWVIMISQY